MYKNVTPWFRKVAKNKIMTKRIDFIITNKGILRSSELNALTFESDHTVYEVIRVIDGIALFLEDHFSRLINSVKIAGLRFEMEFVEFKQKIDELIILNENSTGNVKFVFSEITNTFQWSFSFILHNYPDYNDFDQGVSTGLLLAVRTNPNAKIIQNSIRERANKMIEDQKFYEVLLVDQDGKITEGSRSNVFFVRDNRFYTAPASKVLVGVTRQKILECLEELDFTVIDEAVSASEIDTFDAVFLSGTSPKVLPVNCIGKTQFSVNNFYMSQLMDKYNLMVESYLNTHKK